MAEQRLNVFPSRMVLTGIKERLSAAKTGWDLLKRKSDAIKVNLNNILKKILVTKRRVGVSLKESAFAHTEAQWAAGDFNNQVIENTSEATYRIRTKVNNVAGVKLPVFDRAATYTTSKDILVGLSKGGQAVNKCRESYLKTLDDCVQLASLQTSLKTLDEALKVTNRRVNALEFVVMPQLNNTVKYIISELDELEREDQYRIKKVKDIRTQQDEIEQAEYETEQARIKAEVEARGGAPVAGAAQQVNGGGGKKGKKGKEKSAIQQEQYAVDALMD